MTASRFCDVFAAATFLAAALRKLLRPLPPSRSPATRRRPSGFYPQQRILVRRLPDCSGVAVFRMNPSDQAPVRMVSTNRARSAFAATVSSPSALSFALPNEYLTGRGIARPVSPHRTVPPFRRCAAGGRSCPLPVGFPFPGCVARSAAGPFARGGSRL